MKEKANGLSERKEEKRESLFFFFKKYCREGNVDEYLGHAIKRWVWVWTSMLGHVPQCMGKPGKQSGHVE